jgi:hypothetical protein
MSQVVLGKAEPFGVRDRRCDPVGAKKDNFHLFWRDLIDNDSGPRLSSLKRKRVFAEKQSLEVVIMKLVQSLVVAAALAIPAVSSFAQSNQPVTRAEVKAQLVQLEKAGYQPGAGDRTQYPRNIQAAEARVSAANGAATDVGGIADGTSASGTHHPLRAFDHAVARLDHKVKASIRPDANDGMKPVYFGS